MTTEPRTLKQRIKAHAPEILIATGIVMTVAGVIITRKTAAKELSHFFKNAADPTVEVILGNDNAFVVMTAEAAEILESENFLTLHEGTAGIYRLMFTEANA